MVQDGTEGRPVVLIHDDGAQAFMPKWHDVERSNAAIGTRRPRMQSRHGPLIPMCPGRGGGGRRAWREGVPYTLTTGYGHHRREACLSGTEVVSVGPPVPIRLLYAPLACYVRFPRFFVFLFSLSSLSCVLSGFGFCCFLSLLFLLRRSFALQSFKHVS